MQKNIFNTHPHDSDTMLPPVHPPPREEISIDSIVEIRDLRSNEIEVYTLAAPNDANILENRISSVTPLGRALYGRRVGDVVEYEAPAGVVRVRIEAIRRPISV